MFVAACPSPFPVYCVLAGEVYADHYADRLYHMLGRHMPWPFELTCLTDRERPPHPGIRQRVCAEARHKGYYLKLKMFDRGEVDHEAFLYLDVTSVVFRNLEPLLCFGLNAGKAVVAVEDWAHGELNSSVMVIRPCPLTHEIYEDFTAGKNYESSYGRSHGDQAYMAAVLQDRGKLDEFVKFPPEWVPGFRYLQRRHRRDSSSLEKTLAQALILKFHGRPKPHQLLDPRQALRMALRKPLCLNHDFGFMCDFLLEHWR